MESFLPCPIVARVATDWRVHLYDAGAAFYGFFTESEVWRRANARLVLHFPINARKVLDLGCGTGVTAIAEARERPLAEVIGVDISHQMLVRAERARDRCEPGVARRITFVEADAARLPFADATFDVVTGHSFLYLLPDRDAVLAEVRRVLRPGGRAIFMEPRTSTLSPRSLLTYGRDLRFLVSIAMWRLFSHYNGRFTAATLLSALEKAGLSPMTSEEVLAGLGVIGVAERNSHP